MNREKSAVHLNRTPLDALIEAYGLRKETADLFVAGRPYASAADVLRNEALMKQANAEELTRLLATPDRAAANRGVPACRRRVVSTLDDGAVCGVMEAHDGQSRLFLEHPNGSPLVSCGLRKDAPDQFDFSSLHIAGMPPWELAALPSVARNACNLLLHTHAALASGRLWQLRDAELISAGLTTPISALSQVLFLLQNATSPAATGADGKWKTDGCTDVPDFDIEACCNAHDICYCKGGTEADRLRCDEALYACIKKNSVFGAALAIIYY